MIAIYENGKLIRVEGKLSDYSRILELATLPKPVTTKTVGLLRPGSLPISRRERKESKRMTIECPDCLADVSVPGDSDMADVLECEECRVQLEIIGLDPIEVEVVEEEDLDEGYD